MKDNNAMSWCLVLEKLKILNYLKGFDVAGRAIAALKDTRLVFVGATEAKHEEIAQRLNRCGVPLSCLRVRDFVQDRESLKRLFQEVDLVVMPSRTEGFGFRGTQWICSSKYLFFRQIFAGWEIWKKYVLGNWKIVGV